MQRRTELLLVALWLGIVIPQVLLGFGSAEDSWLLASAAERILETGTYTVSRSSGFPLYEFLLTPIAHYGGPVAANLLSTVAGGLFLLALFRLAGDGEFKHPLLAVLGIGFLPIVTEQATATIDFAFLLMFWGWSYRALRKGQYLTFALVVGVACGFRPTAGLLVVPGLVYVWTKERNPSLAVRVFLTALVTGTLAFSPALLRYGLRDVTVPLHHAIPLSAWLMIAGYNLLIIFGAVQSAVLVGLAAWSARGATRQSIMEPQVLFHTTNIAMWAALFFYMPMKPEYCIAAVPSVVMLLDRFVPRKEAFAALVAVLLSYHVVQIDLLGGESGMRRIEPSVGAGYTIKHIRARTWMVSTREASTEFVAAQPTVLMFAETWTVANNPAWVLDEEIGLYRQREGNLYVAPRIVDVDRLRELSERGFRLVVWRGQKNELVYMAGEGWQQYVTMVDRLEDFYGHPIEGTPLQ